MELKEKINKAINKKQRVEWRAWADKQPHCHDMVAYLTLPQARKFDRLFNYESMTEGCEYAIKVGFPVYDNGSLVTNKI